MTEDLVGGAALDHHGEPITDETIEAAKAADAVLFGAVGGPRWDKLGFDKRPEIAILRLRKELGLFANLRPAIVLDPLVDASTLKPDVVRGLDLMIVRESTGGIYFGEPRGVETLPDGQQRGFNVGDALQVADALKQRLLELRSAEARLAAELGFLAAAAAAALAARAQEKAGERGARRRAGRRVPHASGTVLREAFFAQLARASGTGFEHVRAGRVRRAAARSVPTRRSRSTGAVEAPPSPQHRYRCAIRSAASTTLRISATFVTGPTPPGTGVISAATVETSA